MRCLLAITIELCFLLHVSASTYYVATNGADAADGSSGTPWLTLQKAMNTMVAGDNTVVRYGIYTNEWWNTTRSGTAADPIVIEGENFPLLGAMEFNHSFNTIRGFSFRSLAASGRCIGIKLGVSNCVIQGNRFEETGDVKGQVWLQHSDPESPQNISILNNLFLHTRYYALSLQGSGHTVISNRFESTNAADAIYLNANNCLVQRNVWTNWTRPEGSSGHDDLIQAFSSNGEYSTNNTIDANVAVSCLGTQIGNVTDDGSEWRVSNWLWSNNVFDQVDAMINMTAPRMRWYNNVFYRCGTNGAGPLLFRSNSVTAGAAHSCEAVNNVFLECGTNPGQDWQGWYSTLGAITNFYADYNLVIGTGAGTTKDATFSEAHGINGQDPLFVSIPGHDFRLGAGSPAIGTGADLSSVFTADIELATRVAPWDIGAYEYLPTDGTTATAGTVNVGTLNITP